MSPAPAAAARVAPAVARTAIARGGLAVLAGALLLLWPCALNGYPLVFIDTASYLWQTVVPEMTWDKPWVYGPFLHLGHLRRTLWASVLLQALCLSWLLCLAGRVALGRPSPGRHLLACAGLAALTALPWVASTLMPDAFTGAVTLCLFTLGFGWDRLARVERAGVLLLGVLAIAVHLSHLIQAAALVLLVLTLTRRWQPAWRAAAPLLGAVVVILLTNAVGHGRATLSPYGATFLLARLQEDGSAARTLRERCPAFAPGTGWYLCGFPDAVPSDSDWFLWAPESPVNRDAAGAERVMGSARLAPEAAAIIAATLRDHPGAVLLDSARNALTQLVRALVGDTLGDRYLDVSTGIWIGRGFPPAELARYEAGLQARGRLPEAAAPFLWPHAAVLLLAAPLALLAWWRAARGGDRARLGVVLCALVGLTANAAATGILSKPHHRYEARIIWLLPLAAAWGLARPRPADPPPARFPAAGDRAGGDAPGQAARAAAAGSSRTSAS